MRAGVSAAELRMSRRDPAEDQARGYPTSSTRYCEPGGRRRGFFDLKERLVAAVQRARRIPWLVHSMSRVGRRDAATGRLLRAASTEPADHVTLTAPSSRTTGRCLASAAMRSSACESIRRMCSRSAFLVIVSSAAGHRPDVQVSRHIRSSPACRSRARALGSAASLALSRSPSDARNVLRSSPCSAQCRARRA